MHSCLHFPAITSIPQPPQGTCIRTHDKAKGGKDWGCSIYLLVFAETFLFKKFPLFKICLKHWNIFLETFLLWLLNSNSLFLFMLEFSWFLVWRVIFYWNLEIWGVMRLRFLFQCSVLANLLWRHSGEGRGDLASSAGEGGGGNLSYQLSLCLHLLGKSLFIAGWRWDFELPSELLLILSWLEEPGVPHYYSPSVSSTENMGKGSLVTAIVVKVPTLH